MLLFLVGCSLNFDGCSGTFAVTAYQWHRRGRPALGWLKLALSFFVYSHAALCRMWQLSLKRERRVGLAIDESVSNLRLRTVAFGKLER